MSTCEVPKVPSVFALHTSRTIITHLQTLTSATRVLYVDVRSNLVGTSGPRRWETMQPSGPSRISARDPRPGPTLGAVLRWLHEHKTTDARHLPFRTSSRLRAQILPIPENRSALCPCTLHRVDVEILLRADPRDLDLIQR